MVLATDPLSSTDARAWRRSDHGDEKVSPSPNNLPRVPADGQILGRQAAKATRTSRLESGCVATLRLSSTSGTFVSNTSSAADSSRGVVPPYRPKPSSARPLFSNLRYSPRHEREQFQSAAFVTMLSGGRLTRTSELRTVEQGRGTARAHPRTHHAEGRHIVPCQTLHRLRYYRAEGCVGRFRF